MRLRMGVSLACALVVMMGIAGCGRGEMDRGGRMLVTASIAPLADFAKQVGGKYVEVELLVPPGASPHTYQLEPSQMEMLSRASVLVLNGAGLEYWAKKAVDAAANPRLVAMDTARGMKLLDSDPEHPSGNPHVWLDPVNAIRQVEAIRDAFKRADPEHASEYRANAAAYIGRLRHLDQEIRAQVKMFRARSFVAFHPAWVYFAKRYSLTQAAVIERSPGREPSPGEIREVVDTVRRLKAKAVFAEPQFSPKAADVVAAESGAKVIFLDPLGKPPDYDYIETMRSNLRQMSEGLR